MKLIFLTVILIFIWFITDNWFLDVAISFFVVALTIVSWIKLLLSIYTQKKKEMFFYLFLLISTVSSFILVGDGIYVYKNCQEKQRQIVASKSCDFNRMTNTASFRKNSFLLKERGLGFTCQIYIEVNQSKVLVKNPFLGSSIYKCKRTM